MATMNLPSPGTRLRIAMVTNIPAPYRVPVYERLAAMPGIDFRAIFCAAREPDRDWDLPSWHFDSVTLEPRQFTVGERYIHVNFDVGAKLAEFGPDVVITTGYNPTHLLAWWYARKRAAAHVVMTDGTDQFERGYSGLHRAVRKMVIGSSQAFVGTGVGSMRLLQSYGVEREHFFRAPLGTDNARFEGHEPSDAPPDDLLFCGRFAPGKLPMFAIDVAVATAQQLGRRLRFVMLGDGPMKAAIVERGRDAATAQWVDLQLPGFATQNELPRHYARAGVFLFTTDRDAWGVVANEACAAALPVLITPHAGAAHDLIVDGDNGLVLPVSVERWAAAAAQLLANPRLRRQMGLRGRERVQAFGPTQAAEGIADAARHARARLRAAKRDPVAATISAR